MVALILILVTAIYLAFLYPLLQKQPAEVEHSAKYQTQMKKLWNAAQDSMRDQKPLRAEKALLTILKFDEKNAAAYNRLGILYAKEQKFDEAIECFEIAQSLDNNPSSLHNVGLIYLETGAFEKAAMAFEQAIELEDTLPARFLALAKAKERLGQNKAAIEALEKAYALNNNVSILRQILAVYESAGDIENITATTARIESKLAEDTAAKINKSAPRRARATATTRVPRRTAVKPAPRRTIKPAPRRTIKPASSRTIRPATSPRAIIKPAPEAVKPVAQASTPSASRVIKPASRRKRI